MLGKESSTTLLGRGSVAIERVRSSPIRQPGLFGAYDKRRSTP